MSDEKLDLFFAFLRRTNEGVCAAYYEVDIESHNENSIILENATKNAFIETSRFVLAQYLDSCYKKLCNRDNSSQIQKDFAPFNDHSPHCFFFLAFQISVQTWRNMNFSNIIWKTKLEFLFTFQKEWMYVEGDCHNEYQIKFMHTFCNGPTLQQCDPLKSMFNFANESTFPKEKNISWMCVKCERPGILRCVACKKAHYCSKEHQKTDWKRHKLQCQLIKS